MTTMKKKNKKTKKNVEFEIEDNDENIEKIISNNNDLLVCTIFQWK